MLIAYIIGFYYNIQSVTCLYLYHIIIILIFNFAISLMNSQNHLIILGHKPHKYVYLHYSNWKSLNLMIRQHWHFLNLIPVAEQYSSNARIGPHHWGHRTGAVLSSDKHWHAVLKHCLALLESYDSCTAVSAVTGRSGVLVTVLGHCQALPYDPVTASVKDLPNV